MAFRRRPLPEPKSHKEVRQEHEQKAEDRMHDKVETLFGFTEEEVELMRKCICPRANCPIHPGEDLSQFRPKPIETGRSRRRK